MWVESAQIIYISFAIILIKVKSHKILYERKLLFCAKIVYKLYAKGVKIALKVVKPAKLMNWLGR